MHNYQEFNDLEFDVKDIHLKLLERIYINWNEDMYDGYVCMDGKRPYGNSNIPGDVLELLGIGNGDYTDEQEEMALDIHRQMYIVFRILIDNKSIKTGMYKRENHVSWQKGCEWRPVERKICEDKYDLEVVGNQITITIKDNT